MTDKTILQTINAVSRRLNDVQSQLDRFTIAKNKETEAGVVDVAEIISEQNDAILEIAEIVSGLVEESEV